MPYTTAKLIRNKQSTLISALESDDLRGNKFREYDRSEPFTDWADANPRACLRMFYIEDLATYESPLISDAQLEQVQTNFRIQVAYPKDARYSKSLKSSRADAMDLIESDRKDIDKAIGLLGSADYVSGQNSAIALSKDVEELENVWILSFDLDVIYYLNVGLDLTACVAAITPSATVSAACVLGYPLAAAIAASASIVADCTFAAGASYTLDTLTPAQVATITGKSAPTLMWLGKDVSGANELVAGTADLTDSGVTKEVADATLSGTATGFDNNTTDSMDAAGSTVADVGAETVTVVWIGRPTATPTALKGILGKSQAGPTGYDLQFINTGISWNVGSATGLITRTVSASHGTVNAQVVLATREWTADVASIFTREGSSQGTRYQETLANSGTFSIGTIRTAQATGQNFGALMIWIGTSGNGFGEAERLAIAQALGYEA